MDGQISDVGKAGLTLLFCVNSLGFALGKMRTHDWSLLAVVNFVAITSLPFAALLDVLQAVQGMAK